MLVFIVFLISIRAHDSILYSRKDVRDRRKVGEYCHATIIDAGHSLPRCRIGGAGIRQAMWSIGINEVHVVFTRVQPGVLMAMRVRALDPRLHRFSLLCDTFVHSWRTQRFCWICHVIYSISGYPSSQAFNLHLHWRHRTSLQPPLQLLFCVTLSGALDNNTACPSVHLATPFLTHDKYTASLGFDSYFAARSSVSCLSNVAKLLMQI